MNCLECKEYDNEKYYCPKFCSVIRGAMDDMREYFVPVIRCKDCKYWQFYDSVKANVCKRRYDKHYWQSHEDDFCSRAERKEE